MREQPAAHNRSVRPAAGPVIVAAIAVAALTTGLYAVIAPTLRPGDGVRLDIQFVASPETIVERMLELAAPKPGELLIDLGSGDGRIPIRAAMRYGVRAIGIDIDPARIAEANINADIAGVTDKVVFKREDMFAADIAKADIVTLFLLEELNVRLRPRLLSELRPGARIVSHTFAMGDWKPDRHERVDGRNLYLWIVPDRPAASTGTAPPK